MATAIDVHSEIRTDLRSEARTETIRIVEYAEFPRRVSNRGLRMGFTRDISDSGVCLGADHPETIGSLLRLGIRALDGGYSDSRVGRVAWTSEARDGRHWIGVELLTGASDFGETAPRALIRTQSNGPGLRGD